MYGALVHHLMRYALIVEYDRADLRFQMASDPEGDSKSIPYSACRNKHGAEEMAEGVCIKNIFQNHALSLIVFN